MEITTKDGQILKDELKENISELFSVGLVRCTKATARFDLKENVQVDFKRHVNVPLASAEKLTKN